MRLLARTFVLGLAVAGCGGGGASSPSGAGGGSATTTQTTTTGTTTTSTFTTSSTTSSTTGTTSSTTSSTTGTTSSTTPTTSGTGGGAQHGDCMTDADCPGGTCVPITPGGFLVCAIPPEKTTTCGSPLDQCCANMPCPNNEPCYAGPLVPFCAGIPMEPHNQCAVDQCSQDVDCAPAQICGVAGALGHQIRACVSASCKVDAHCTTAPGGICAPIMDPCCGVFVGLFCVYPGGGCRSNADCGPGNFCQITGDSATCQPGDPLCPL